MVLHLAAATRVAIRQRNWYAALSLALTLPDICGRLESPNVRSQARYEAWWEAWVQERFASPSGPLVTGGDAYALRCAVLHEGRDDIVTQKARDAVERFVFVEPGESQNSPLYAMIESVVVVRVDQFCEDVCLGVDQWSAQVRSRSGAVANRSSHLMKIMRYPLQVGPALISG